MSKSTDYHANVTLYVEQVANGEFYLFARKDVDLLCAIPFATKDEAEKELWARVEGMRKLLASSWTTLSPEPTTSSATPVIKSISSEMLDGVENIILNREQEYRTARSLAHTILKALGYEDK